jgi:phosphoribosylformylglycinamidine cyclo-ligase
VLKFVEIEEAMRTFNMGYGMILIVSRENLNKVLELTGGEVIGVVSKNTKIVVQ